MSKKLLHIFPRSSLVLVFFLFCLIEHTQISNATAICQFFDNGRPGIYLKVCPYTCCPTNSQTRENTTCCDPPSTYATVVETTSSFFGYSWWAFFLSTVCLFLVSSIMIHYCKRTHFFNHSKTFNSVVNPAAAFTISQKAPSINATCYYSPETNAVVLEQDPPSYAKVGSTPSPPPYTAVNVGTARVWNK